MNEEESNLIFRAAPEDAGRRLDAFLAEKIDGWSRSRLQKLIDAGDVSVDGKQVKSSYKFEGGEEIEVELAETLTEDFMPEEIPLDIVFEDDFLVVVNKPAGMVVHPGAGVSSGTLANALAYKFNLQNSELKIESGMDEQSKIRNLKSKIGMVHRLDKDTSGLMVVAKSERVHEALSEQFRERTIYKSYVALVHGAMREERGKIDAPIARDRNNRLKMAVQKLGRHALTVWRVRQRFERFSLLQIEIKTGRTHQIRVHMAFINHPVVGDETYNNGRDKTVADAKVKKAIGDLNRFFLHAERLCFDHPETHERMDFKAPLAPELADFLEKI